MEGNLTQGEGRDHAFELVGGWAVVFVVVLVVVAMVVVVGEFLLLSLQRTRKIILFDDRCIDLLIN